MSPREVRAALAKARAEYSYHALTFVLAIAALLVLGLAGSAELVAGQ